MSNKIVDIFKNLEYGPAPESDENVTAWLENGARKFTPFINGKFIVDKNHEYFETVAPGDGRILGKIAQATEKDVDTAVRAARKAQKDWAALPGSERAQYLYKIARIIYDRARSFEVLESLDNGKAFRETHNADIPLAIKHFDHHADFANIVDMDSEFNEYEPHGVVGQIIPWNFPLLMLAWKIAPALATGNTVVLKPAELTPLSAMMFAEVCAEAGLPPGVVNIITGDGHVGAMITQHKDINKVAFTGSTDVGRIIRKATAGTGKSLTLELGGKSPFIVLDDADLDSAVEGVVNAIFFNGGQVCCGGSRLLIQESIKDQFIDKLKSRMDKMRIGGPLDKSIDMGAIVDRTQWERISGFVEEARAGGADIHQPCTTDSKGCFYPPTLVTNVSTSDRIIQEEVFGPVIAAMSFRTYDEAIALANNTAFGLAASVWTENSSKANEISSRLKCGVVWQNGTNQFDAMAGFGGYRESGYGREGGYEGLFAYMKHASEKGMDKEADIAKPSRKFTSTLQDDVDLTRKLFIGGAEKRADGGDVLSVVNDDDVLLGRIGNGNRKDIRNAVEAAQKAEGGWAGKTPAQRGQVLKFIAERLSLRSNEFAEKLQQSAGYTQEKAKKEVAQSINALFNAAAWASKYEGRVHRPADGKSIIPALNEQIGVVGIAAPNEDPLLSFVTLTAMAMAMGNTVVAVPSEKHPLPAMDLAQIFRTSDVPSGIINIVTGDRDELSEVLTKHDEVDAMWYHGSTAGSKMVEEVSAAGNLKQSWVNNGKAFNWEALATKDSKQLARRATQLKNIWVPWGEGVGGPG